jgi:hypothetical protein
MAGMAGTSDRLLELASGARRAVLRLDPTERPRLVVPGTGGPHPLVQGLLGPVAMALTHTYYLAVTDRSVFVLRGPRSTGEPKEALAVVPLEQAGALVAKVAHGRRRSRVWLRLPQAKRPVRMEVWFTSRPQLDAFLAKL